MSACGGTDCDSYAEPDDPSPMSQAEWAAVTPGLHASMGSIDERYFRGEVPEVAQTREWSGSAWRGEKISTQMVVWSTEPIQLLRLHWHER